MSTERVLCMDGVMRFPVWRPEYRGVSKPHPKVVEPTSWPMPMKPCLRHNMTPSVLHVARTVEQAFGLPFEKWMKKSSRRGLQFGIKPAVALSAFYWACIVFTKLSTNHIANCLGRDHSSVVKTARLIMAEALIKKREIPTTSLPEALQWIAENITSLPGWREMRCLQTFVRPVKVAR
jgi:hypothetical protein